MIRSILENLRQVIYYPKEFRIASLNWPELIEAFDIISYPSQPDTTAITANTNKTDEELLKLVMYISTFVWRLQLRMSTKGDAVEEIRRISRDLESTWDTLKQSGIEIKDHTGEKYSTGMALDVIAFQPMPELSYEKIIETIKPTIYHKDKIVQSGKVIVGIPEQDTTDGSDNEPA